MYTLGSKGWAQRVVFDGKCKISALITLKIESSCLSQGALRRINPMFQYFIAPI